MMLVVGLGEVLWDLFPEGKQLGGAPANFAYITNLLGDRGIIASRVGDDAFGDEIQQRLGTLGLEASYLQSDSARPTGTVRVRVDQDGQPRFEITDMVAWDFLEWTPAWESLAQQADAICFGSLAQRSPASRETIHKFLGAARPGTARIFDVNLRQAFYSAKALSESLKFADIAKLNAEELPHVVELLGIPHHGEQPSAERLRFAYGLKLVCVTRGARGSFLVSEFERHEHPGFRVQVGGRRRRLHRGPRSSFSPRRWARRHERGRQPHRRLGRKLRGRDSFVRRRAVAPHPCNDSLGPPASRWIQQI